jgi:hypothetical protein
MAERVLGGRKREKYEHWFDEECQKQATTAKYVAYKIMQQKIVEQTQ